MPWCLNVLLLPVRWQYRPNRSGGDVVGHRRRYRAVAASPALVCPSINWRDVARGRICARRKGSRPSCHQTDGTASARTPQPMLVIMDALGVSWQHFASARRLAPPTTHCRANAHRASVSSRARARRGTSFAARLHKPQSPLGAEPLLRASAFTAINGQHLPSSQNAYADWLA